jgi:phosphatidylserine decarboxylase
VGVPLALSGRRTGWALLGVAATVVAFFRDPERPLPTDPDLVYAASDGFVDRVDDGVEEPWLPDERATRVTVFLSLTDVHVNRSPVAGTLTRSEQVGTASRRRCSRERRTTAATGCRSTVRPGPVVVVQVAGALARTISNWVRVGDRLVAGQRLGVIHFGSRTDVLRAPGHGRRPGVQGHPRDRGRHPLFRLRAR